ncbi:MAG TPA: 30S ribosomal protein S7 [Phycisphaerales bacterium]|nr:30S ribosomal protein S7 [Phycisphaerales bacterium]
MGGRITRSAEQLRPDPVHGDRVLAKFTNCIMLDGKKSVAQRNIYAALDNIQARLDKVDDPNAPKSALDCFHMAIEKVKPFVEVRSKRIGGANYQVPMQVDRKRQQALAFRWIIQAARSEKGRPIADRLADEIFNAARGEGKAISKREEVHRMAEANKAFSHFA